jgi:hypothetical protein
MLEMRGEIGGEINAFSPSQGNIQVAISAEGTLSGAVVGTR